MPSPEKSESTNARGNANHLVHRLHSNTSVQGKELARIPTASRAWTVGYMPGHAARLVSSHPNDDPVHLECMTRMRPRNPLLIDIGEKLVEWSLIQLAAEEAGCAYHRAKVFENELDVPKVYM